MTFRLDRPGVLPEDADAWQVLSEVDWKRLERDWKGYKNWEHDFDFDERLKRLPEPFVLYDLDRGLGEIGEGNFDEDADDLHCCTLHALQRATQPDEWVYALDAPERSWWYGYRFWPHRVTDKTRWYASPIPNGDNQYFLCQDLQSGILSFFGGAGWWWLLCVFGQRLLDAFAAEPPRAFSHIKERSPGVPI